MRHSSGMSRFWPGGLCISREDWRNFLACTDDEYREQLITDIFWARQSECYQVAFVRITESLRCLPFSIEHENGELKYIAEDYDSEVGELTVAEIKDSAGDKKYIRFGDRGNDESEPLLYFNKSTAKGGNLRDIPMYNEDEFSEMFGPETSVTKLFTHPEEIMSPVK